MYNIKDIPKTELLPFLEKSNWHGTVTVLVNWGLIYAALATCAYYPNPLCIFFAMIIIGGRQLGLGILMHECAHRSLFKSPFLNEIVGQWLCAAPVLLELHGYRKYHLTHHRSAGTKNDPDYVTYKPYPVSKKSFLRKIIRDLTGVTGIKTVIVLILMTLNLKKYELSYKPEDKEEDDSKQNLAVGVFRLALLIGIQLLLAASFFMLFGKWWAYLVWAGSYLTTYMLFARIRNASEHAAVADLLNPNPLKHTRTTLVSWWERLTIAPNHVNYHLEHHLLPNVPHQNLSKLHKTLKKSEAYQDAEIVKGYIAVIEKLVCA